MGLQSLIFLDECFRSAADLPPLTFHLLAELNPGTWLFLGEGVLTTPPARSTGLGTDATALWFSAPTENLDGGSDTEVRFYVNGTLALTQRLDLATNRSVALADLGSPATGDVVQV
ncbi:MAG: hypothetical protein ACLFU8_16865, partial [Anaerolineales bacterium]